jgi:HK97 family phage major capsid protein
LNNDTKTEKNAKDSQAQTMKTVTELVDQMTDKIVTALNGAKGTEVKGTVKEEVKTKLFSGGSLKEIEYPSDVTALNKDEKIVFFFKSLLYAKSDAQSAQVLKALVEGTDADGGYLVPEELRSEVFRILPDFSVMRRVARVIPMQTNSLKLNSLTARPVAYWTAEYASKSTTSAEFAQVELVPNDLVCLLPVSEQLLADANISMVQFIVELFAEAIALAEDKAFFTGSGSGQPRGINQESLTSVDAGGAGTFDHIIALTDSVPQRVRTSPGAAFVMHSYALRIARQIKDSQGRYIWSPGDPNNGRPESLYGYPVYEQNDLAQTEIYFGDWKNYIIGDRQQMKVATTTEGGEAWRRNAVEIKAVSRVDGRAVLTRPFAKITNWR